MNSKNKPEVVSQLRVPKAKHKLGLKIPSIAMPHDDLIRAEKPHLEMVAPIETLHSETTQTRQSSRSSQTRQTRHPAPSGDEIAPTKNYQKVPNSITKQAIPDGLFIGKSKQLYDVLYGLTRGAISPKRKIRISKVKLMKQSGIGSRITFDSCVTRLQTVGLLKTTILPGEHEGNEFEILLPEELGTLSSLTRQSSLTTPASLTTQTTQTDSAQKPDRLVSLETSQSSQSLNHEESSSYETPKTSFKDFKSNDDESDAAFSGLIGELSRACEKITGKRPAARDVEKWRSLGEVLVLELEIAARRTGQVSNVPAFLTEVLRRKLLSQPSPQPKSKGANADTVGKPVSGEFEIKALSEWGREAALVELREFAGDDFFDDFQKWYTPEDWQWLTTRLGNSADS